jgi:CheY-like chemotaxis protein
MSIFTPSRTVLHIDDDEDDSLLIEMSLSVVDPSITFKKAGNGKSGLEMLTDLCAEGCTPILVILDLNMPIMNGYDTIQVIKNDPVFNTIPVVIFSTSSSLEDRAKWQHEQVLMLSKPYSLDGYIDCLKSMLTVYKLEQV